MKKIFLLLGLLLFVSMVTAIESTPIKIEPMVRFIEQNEYSANIEIELADDIYGRTYTLEIRFNNTLLNLTDPNATETDGIYVMVADSSPHILDNWESFGFDIVRDFANQTELFDVVDTCSEYIDNVTSCYTQTNAYRDRFDELYESSLSMVNKTYHTDITNNLTAELESTESSYESLQRNKDTETATLQERIVELERHRQWGWGGAIIGVGSSLYLLNKYRGLGKRKQQVETEFPKDVAV